MGNNRGTVPESIYLDFSRPADASRSLRLDSLMPRGGRVLVTLDIQLVIALPNASVWIDRSRNGDESRMVDREIYGPMF